MSSSSHPSGPYAAATSLPTSPPTIAHTTTDNQTASNTLKNISTSSSSQYSLPPSNPQSQQPSSSSLATESPSKTPSSSSQKHSLPPLSSPSYSSVSSPPVFSPTSPFSPSAAAGYFAFPVAYSVNGLLRRLSNDPQSQNAPKSTGMRKKSDSSSVRTGSLPRTLSNSFAWATRSSSRSGTSTPTASSFSQSAYSQGGIGYAPAPIPRTYSPFQPPPLTPLQLSTGSPSDQQQEDSDIILSTALAEEIRLLVPAALQLVDTWSLVFGLERDGVSLATLYSLCEEYRGKRGGFVLLVKDEGGSVSFPRPIYLHLKHILTHYLVDIRSIPLLSTTPFSPFLRHRRMFSLASHNPIQSPLSTSLSLHHRPIISSTPIHKLIILRRPRVPSFKTPSASLGGYHKRNEEYYAKLHVQRAK